MSSKSTSLKGKKDQDEKNSSDDEANEELSMSLTNQEKDDRFKEFVDSSEIIYNDPGESFNESQDECYHNSQAKRDELRRGPLRTDEDEVKDRASVRSHKYNLRNRSNLFSPPNEKFKHSSPVVHQKVSHPAKEDESNSLNEKPMYILICVGIYLIALIASMAVLPDIGQRTNEGYSTWHKKLRDLKEEFPSIKNWKQVNVSVSRVYEARKNPGVLLLMGETERSANCFAKKILSFFDNKPQDVKELLKKHPDPIDMKDNLHRSLDTYLSKESVFGLLNIDQLNGKSAMVFHSFCDNENAPYPRSLIVLTLPYPSTSFDREGAESVIEEYLANRWANDITFDKASPLVNRIIAYPAYVPVESVDPCPS